jgi:anti-anti-sigma factor
MIEMQCTPQDGGLVVSVIGRLDTSAAAAFNRKFKYDVLARGDKRVVLDFSKLDYISSLGLSCVLNSAQAIKNNGGELVLCSLGEMVRQVFQVAGLISFFTIFDTTEKALAGRTPLSKW